MDIVARINLPHKRPPARVYVYGLGLNECFSGNDSITEALGYFDNVHRMAQTKIPFVDEIEYFISCVWGNIKTDEKIVDLFGFHDIKEWPGNPTVSAWTVRNGVFVRNSEITCGDTLIILGKEESYRRYRSNLEEFLMNPPDVGREDAIPVRKVNVLPD